MKGKMENEAQKTQEQAELEAAQKRLAEAKQAVALREKMLLDKAAADLAAHRAEAERKLAEEKRERERIEAMHAKRKAERQAAEEAERQAKLAEERRLEAEFAAREQDARDKAKKETEVKKVQDAAFALEQEAKRLEAELRRNRPLITEDPTYTAPISEVGVDTDTGGRERLFARTLQSQSQREAENKTPEAPKETPSEYLVKNGRIDPRVFEQRFGVEHRGNFFLAPSTGFLILNGFSFKLDESVSGRIWQHNAEVYVALTTSGYELRKVGTSDSVRVIPLGISEGCTFEPLPSEAVDQTEVLLCERSR
jgi:hypothetical protein